MSTSAPGRPKAAVRVVGMVAGHRQHIAADVALGDPVLARPEPDNAHDPNAVAIFTMPRSRLAEPDALTSSVTDPDGVGSIGEADRSTILARQAGYVPREFAAALALPAEGIIGWVSAVRHPPPEYDAYGAPLAMDPVGFDVTAAWPRR